MTSVAVRVRWSRAAPAVFLAAFGVGCTPTADTPPGPTGYSAVRDIEARYVALEQRAGRLRAFATDSIAAERLRIETAAVTRDIAAMQQIFERMTAALSTEQLSTILPAWERLALAQAGLALLYEDALVLQADPRLTGAEVRGLADAVNAVAGFAAYNGRSARMRLGGRLRIA